MNNVEQIWIKGTQGAGKKFTVTVGASSVPSGPQPYALVVSADLDQSIDGVGDGSGSGGGMSTGGVVFLLIGLGSAFTLSEAFYNKRYGDGVQASPRCVLPGPRASPARSRATLDL